MLRYLYAAFLALLILAPLTPYASARDTVLEEVAQQPVYKTTPPAEDRYRKIVQKRIARIYDFHQPDFPKAEEVCLSEYYEASLCTQGRKNAEVSYIQNNIATDLPPMARFENCQTLVSRQTQLATPDICENIHTQEASQAIETYNQNSWHMISRYRLKHAEEFCIDEGYMTITCENVYRIKYEKTLSVPAEIFWICMMFIVGGLTLYMMYHTFITGKLLEP